MQDGNLREALRPMRGTSLARACVMGQTRGAIAAALAGGLAFGAGAAAGAILAGASGGGAAGPFTVPFAACALLRLGAVELSRRLPEPPRAVP